MCDASHSEINSPEAYLARFTDWRLKMASKREQSKVDPLVVMEEVARLIEEQSSLALQARDLTRTETELFRVRGKRVELLLELVKAAGKNRLRQKFIG